MTLNCGNSFAHLSDVALLQKLIGVQQSRKLYRGSLQPLFAATETGTAHEKCIVAMELVRRCLREQLKRECLLAAPSAAREYLKLHFVGQGHESFMVLFLDAQNYLIAATELFRGTLTQTSVYPREVVKESLRHNAGAVIFAHNHPSGIAEPSRADEMLTQNLKSALALVDVKVIDHFVVAGASILSFAERGLL